jgi:hypothetical protein
MWKERCGLPNVSSFKLFSEFGFLNYGIICVENSMLRLFAASFTWSSGGFFFIAY